MAVVYRLANVIFTVATETFGCSSVGHTVARAHAGHMHITCIRKLWRGFLLSSRMCSMPRNGANLHVSGGRRPRGNRFRPYTTNPLPSRNAGQPLPRQDDYYGPTQGLFDHESVVDMVSSGVDGVYDSDCENSDPTEGNSSILSGRAPISSTPLRECNQQRHQQHSFRTERPYGMQTPDVVAMLQEQLQNLIRTQESMKETQETMKESQSAFERKLSTLQKQVTDSSSSPTSSSGEKKCKVTRELTVCILSHVYKPYLLQIFLYPKKKVAAVHDALEEPSERYRFVLVWCVLSNVCSYLFAVFW